MSDTLNPLNVVRGPWRQAPRYTARLVVMAEPGQIEKMHALAQRHGHSLAAEVRHAMDEHLGEARIDG